jgi:hypothetical protein
MLRGFNTNPGVSIVPGESKWWLTVGTIYLDHFPDSGDRDMCGRSGLLLLRFCRVPPAVVHQVTHRPTHQDLQPPTRYHLLMKRRVRREEPFAYNAFISYSQKDEAWVQVPH